MSKTTSKKRNQKYQPLSREERKSMKKIKNEKAINCNKCDSNDCGFCMEHNNWCHDVRENCTK